MIIAKTSILCELGHHRLLKPALIERALAANEQAKYYLTLLQNARARAEAPAAHVAELRRERIAVGFDDAALDGVVAGAQKCRIGGRSPHHDRVMVAEKPEKNQPAMPGGGAGGMGDMGF